MARQLADVLHHFLPEAETETNRRPPAPVALPLLAVPIGDRDVVRAAFAWNLAVEIARMGGRTALVAPRREGRSALWPASGTGPLGIEIRLTDARSLGDLQRAATDAAVELAAEAFSGGVVLVRVPPPWLRPPVSDGAGLLRFTLLFSSADPRDLFENYGVAKLVFQANANAQVGVTIHGVQRVAEASQAFERLAEVAARRLDRRLESYGMLLDDLHVYRSIVSQRPVGLEHPQSLAANALRDVAGMLLDASRERAVV